MLDNDLRCKSNFLDNFLDEARCRECAETIFQSKESHYKPLFLRVENLRHIYTCVTFIPLNCAVWSLSIGRVDWQLGVSPSNMLWWSTWTRRKWRNWKLWTYSGKKGQKHRCKNTGSEHSMQKKHFFFGQSIAKHYNFFAFLGGL